MNLSAPIAKTLVKSKWITAGERTTALSAKTQTKDHQLTAGRRECIRGGAEFASQSILAVSGRWFAPLALMGEKSEITINIANMFVGTNAAIRSPAG